jgi:hypothetical protein
MYTKIARCSVAVAMFAGLAASRARAQDPVRLPGVRVTAPLDKPGPRALGGIATDTSANPIDSVEISIPTLKVRVFTDVDGKFRLGDLRPGKYEVRARKIGWAPQIRTMKVESDGGTGTFELLRLEHALPPMVVSVAGGGISGVVGDTTFHPLPGVAVRLAAEGMTTLTDSVGGFHFDVAEGQYFLTVERRGFLPKLVTVRVPKDSGRRVTVFLEPGRRGVQSANNFADLSARLAWRDLKKSTLYTRDDLVDLGIEWIGDAIQGGVTRASVGRAKQVDSDCVAVLNGGPETVMLNSLTIDDVSSVEIYPTGSDRTVLPNRPPSSIVGRKAVADSRPLVPIDNTRRAVIQNSARSCATVYVWTR